MDFSTIEITSKKVRGNNVDFRPAKLRRKKYAEMTWKFVEFWSLTYRRNFHVERRGSMWCGVVTPITTYYIQKNMLKI